MKLKQHIPNAITCGNLLCGCLAIVQTFNGNLVWAAYLVGMAAILDFFDGFFARLLKVSSPIGKDLDSLADMVTFGVVPGFVMFKLLLSARLFEHALELPHQGSVDEYAFSVAYIAFLIPIFSAIRLAKFNNDTRQSDSFIGLPTPANAIFICSLPLILNMGPQFVVNEMNASLVGYIINTKTLVVLSIVLSVLLVAELPLIALKFKSFGWKGNEIRFIFLGLSLGLLIAFQFVGIPLVIILYILISVVNNLVKQ
jgi:CDP-diacylglycerol--serine O-phosphatidyltransferase